MENIKTVNWLSATWYSGKDGVLEAAIKDRSDPERILLCSHTKQYGRRFCGMSREDIVKLVRKPSNRGLYEIIEAHRPRKLYFDVDKSTESLERIKEEIAATFAKGPIFQISGDKTVGTYHIVVSNYYFKNLEANLELKQWCKNRVHLGFDWKVYTGHRQMKLVNQCKPGREPQLILEGSESPDDHIITLQMHLVGPHEMHDARETLRETFTPAERKPLDLTSVRQKKLVLPPDFIDFDTLKPVKVLALIQNPARESGEAVEHKVTLMACLFAKEHLIPFETFWSWARTKDDSSERLARYIKVWDKERSFMPTYRTMSRLLERFYPDLLKPRWTRAMRESLVVKPTKTIDRIHLLPDDIDCAKYTILNLNMGGNKTGTLVALLLELNVPFYWITARVTQAKNTLGRMIEEGLDDVSDYRKLGKDAAERCELIAAARKLVICAQSLRYLDGAPNFKGSFLIVDEIELVMNDWIGSTHGKNRSQNWTIFKRLFSECKRTFLLDAFISRQTLDFVEAIKTPVIDSVEIIQRNVHPDPVRLIEFKTRAQRGKKSSDRSQRDSLAMFHQIAEAIKSGQKCFVFYPYKEGNDNNKGIEEVRALICNLAGLKISDSLCYHADVDDSVVNGLSQVNTSWSKVKFVITNSTITVGVNYDRHDYDVAYIFKAPFNSPRDIVQVSARIRHLTTRTIYILYLTGTVSPNREIYEIDCPLYKRLQYNNEIEHRTRGQKEITTHFFKLANYIIDTSFVTDELDEEVTEYVISMMDDKALIFSWNKINTVTPSEAETLRQQVYRGDATCQEKLEIRKCQFISMFLDDVPHDALEEFWNQKRIQFFTKRKIYYFREDHLLKRIETDLNVPELDRNWDKKRYKISRENRERIFNKFSLNLVIDCTDEMLLSRLLSCYYGMDCYQYEKDGTNGCWIFTEAYKNALRFADIWLNKPEPEPEPDEILI